MARSVRTSSISKSSQCSSLSDSVSSISQPTIPVKSSGKTGSRSSSELSQQKEASPDSCQSCSSRKLKKWMKFSNYGEPVHRFIPFKAPLSEHQLERVNEFNQFTWDIFLCNLEMKSLQLGLIIDLTAGKYFKCCDELVSGIKVERIKAYANGVLKHEVYDRFRKLVHEFLSKDENSLKFIGVFCSTGVDMSGLLICKYLVCNDRWMPSHAIRMFNSSRGHDIGNQVYLNHLKNLKPGSIFVDSENDNHEIPAPKKLCDPSRMSVERATTSSYPCSSNRVPSSCSRPSLSSSSTIYSPSHSSVLSQGLEGISSATEGEESEVEVKLSPKKRSSKAQKRSSSPIGSQTTKSQRGSSLSLCSSRSYSQSRSNSRSLDDSTRRKTSSKTFRETLRRDKSPSVAHKRERQNGKSSPIEDFTNGRISPVNDEVARVMRYTDPKHLQRIKSVEKQCLKSRHSVNRKESVRQSRDQKSRKRELSDSKDENIALHRHKVLSYTKGRVINEGLKVMCDRFSPESSKRRMRKQSPEIDADRLVRQAAKIKQQLSSLGDDDSESDETSHYRKRKVPLEASSKRQESDHRERKSRIPRDNSTSSGLDHKGENSRKRKDKLLDKRDFIGYRSYRSKSPEKITNNRRRSFSRSRSPLKGYRRHLSRSRERSPERSKRNRSRSNKRSRSRRLDEFRNERKESERRRDHKRSISRKRRLSRRKSSPREDPKNTTQDNQTLTKNFMRDLVDQIQNKGLQAEQVSNEIKDKESCDSNTLGSDVEKKPLDLEEYKSRILGVMAQDETASGDLNSHPTTINVMGHVSLDYPANLSSSVLNPLVCHSFPKFSTFENPQDNQGESQTSQEMLQASASEQVTDTSSPAVSSAERQDTSQQPSKTTAASRNPNYRPRFTPETQLISKAIRHYAPKLGGLRPILDGSFTPIARPPPFARMRSPFQNSFTPMRPMIQSQAYPRFLAYPPNVNRMGPRPFGPQNYVRGAPSYSLPRRPIAHQGFSTGQIPLRNGNQPAGMLYGGESVDQSLVSTSTRQSMTSEESQSFNGDPSINLTLL